MSTARLRPGELLAAAGGAALLGVLVMDWYGGATGRTAWQAFRVLDVVLVLVGLAGLGVLVLNLVRDSPAVPVAAEALTIVLALVAALAVAYRLVDQPGPDDAAGLRPGAYLGLLATLAVFYGAYRALRDESGRGAPEPAVELRPAPRGVAAGAAPPAAAPADTPSSVEPDASPAEDPLATPALDPPSGARER